VASIAIFVLGISVAQMATAEPAKAAGSFSITGTVLTQGGDRISGAVLQIRPLKDRLFNDTATQTSGQSGTYTFPGLVPGSYLIMARAPFGSSYAPVYYGDTPFESAAVAITVTTSSVSGRNLTLPLGGTISGTIGFDPSVPIGDRIANARVYIANPATGLLEVAGGHGQLAQVSPGGGAYSIPGVNPGTIVVRFGDATINGDRLLPNFWQDSDWLFDSTLISVTGGATFSGVDVTLSPGGYLVSRLDGADRFAMAVNVSTTGYPDSDLPAGGIDVLYVVNGLDFPDALSAGPAASAEGGPLLLVTPTSVPAVVVAEIQRLRPNRIVVVGGVNSVNDAVLAQLSSLAIGGAIRRGGSDRYEASRNIARHAFTAPVDTAFIVTGAKYPDALAAGAKAGALGGPVILVNNGSFTGLDDATKQLLVDLQVRNVVIVGGYSSVSPMIEDEFASVASLWSVERASGDDRYAAATRVTAANVETDTVFLANGEGFADALAGSWLASSLDAPLLLVRGNCVPASTQARINAYAPKQIVLLGGVNSLNVSIEQLADC
jgi:putative cell wall-binding protein